MVQKLKELRQLTGLSGRQLASILPCTYTQLAMAETGKRSLPEQAITLCNTMHQLLVTQPLLLEIATTLEPTAALVGWLPAWMRLTKHKLELAEIQLTNLEAKIVILQRQIAVAQLIPQQLTLEANSIEALELALMARKAGIRIKEATKKKLQLQLAIAGLQSQINMATSWQDVI